MMSSRFPSPAPPCRRAALAATFIWTIGGTMGAAIGAGGCAGADTDPAPAASSSAALGRPRTPVVTPQTSGTTLRLQAVSPVDARVVWASGVGGTYALTTDGGATWHAAVVPGAETLEFRDVEGVSARVAYLLAAGVGTDSRIYKTVDGGATWTLQFENQDPNGFYDCFAFWTPRRALTMGDAVNGRFPVLRTIDGQRWVDIGDRLPAAQAGEAAFAASGTCVATAGLLHAWIATGGAATARVLATRDGGQTWAAHAVPIVQGTPTSGGFSIAFRDLRHGILGGGELAAPAAVADNFARSRDGGVTWELGTPAPFPGAIFGLSYARGRSLLFFLDAVIGELDMAHGDDDVDSLASIGGARPVVVATGPGGAAWSSDEGDTWTPLEGVTNYWAVAFANPRTGWLVGTQGRILRVDF